MTMSDTAAALLERVQHGMTVMLTPAGRLAKGHPDDVIYFRLAGGARDE